MRGWCLSYKPTPMNIQHQCLPWSTHPVLSSEQIQDPGVAGANHVRGPEVSNEPSRDMILVFIDTGGDEELTMDGGAPDGHVLERYLDLGAGVDPRDGFESHCLWRLSHHPELLGF